MSIAVPSPMPACWRQESAHDILKVEALQDVGRDDLFLATHTPITGFTVEGPGAADVREPTETCLLDALSKPGLRHAFVTVRGEPGSGKSHLIRWLDTQWNNPDDIVVLLQRADATLRGSLEQLKLRVPDKYRSIISDISVQQERSDAGRLDEFVSGLQTMLKPENFVQAPPDAAFCKTFDLSAIFGVPRIRDRWDAPRRLLSVLANADGKRNSQVASFTIYDVLTLLNYSGEIRNASVGAGRLIDALTREQTVIEELERREVPADEALRDHGDRVPRARDFILALNARRNDAIRRSLGVSAERLQDIFMELRRALFADGKRLVLLLEDITNFQGLDDRLIDALVVDAGTRSDICPLISVVGLTPTYFDNELKPNYRQRITHNVALGSDEDGEFVDVTSFTRPDVRARFAANYLAAVRAGRDRIATWHEAGAAGSPPNVCKECPLRPGCHATFGALDGVGLFPFTELALENFYRALKPNQKHQTWRTPRGFIQGVLVPTMTRPDRLTTGQYPPAEIERHEGIDRHETRAPALLGMHIDALSIDQATRARLKTMIVLWGDRDAPYVSADEDGRAFAQVSEDIHRAFALPWLWPDIATPTTLTGTSPIEHLDPEAFTSVDSETAKPEARGPDEKAHAHALAETGGPSPRPATSKVAKPPFKPAVLRPKLPMPARLKTLVEEAALFADDPAAFSPTRKTWTEVAAEAVANSDLIDPAHLDIDRVIFADLFKQTLVKIEGIDPTSHSDRHMVMPKTAWVIDGIVAYAYSREREAFNDLDAQGQALQRLRLSTFARRVLPLMRQHIAKRLPSVDEQPWKLHAAVACTLAARAWLRGGVAPTAPCAEQLLAIFADEGEPTTAPQSRVDSWEKALTATSRWHMQSRATLREALILRQGRGEDGPLDVADTVAALAVLQKSLSLPQSREDIDIDALPYRGALASIGDVHNRLQVIVREEPRRIKELCEWLEVHLYEDNVATRLASLARLIHEADAKLPVGQNPPSVQEWKRAHKRLTEAPNFMNECKDVERSLDEWLACDQRSLDAMTRGEKLAFAARTPYGAMSAIRTAFENGERAASDLVNRITELLTRRPDAAQVDAIRAYGRSIAGAARELSQEIEGAVDAQQA